MPKTLVYTLPETCKTNFRQLRCCDRSFSTKKKYIRAPAFKKFKKIVKKDSVCLEYNCYKTSMSKLNMLALGRIQVKEPTERLANKKIFKKKVFKIDCSQFKDLQLPP